MVWFNPDLEVIVRYLIGFRSRIASQIQLAPDHDHQSGVGISSAYGFISFFSFQGSSYLLPCPFNPVSFRVITGPSGLLIIGSVVCRECGCVQARVLALQLSVLPGQAPSGRQCRVQDPFPSWWSKSPTCSRQHY